MQRRRTIAAAPVRGASEAWDVIVTLLADTLERSPDVPAGTVAKELATLDGLGPALIAAGHLQDSPLVLSDEALEVSIHVNTGDAALSVDENLSAVAGGASATGAWTLQVPTPAPLAAAVAAAIDGSVHLITDTASTPAPSATSLPSAKKVGLLDLAAVRGIGRRP